MARQLLIYQNAVPVTVARHRGISVKTGRDFDFAREVNAVPLMAAEFAQAGQEYAIVFAGEGDDVAPVVLLGVRDDENLFVAEDGAWQGKYVPAFLRRYPFVFSTNDSARSFMLCIDEDYAGVNDAGRGERLFDEDGEQTQYLRSVLEFLQAYQVQFVRTRALAKRLVEMDLLEPMQARFTLRDGRNLSLSGFQTVSREKLRALTGEQLEELSRADDLELIFLHLHSLRYLTDTAERLAALPADTAVAAVDTAPELSAADTATGSVN